MGYNSGFKGLTIPWNRVLEGLIVDQLLKKGLGKKRMYSLDTCLRAVTSNLWPAKLKSLVCKYW
jgi:hypothetical protein